VDSRGTSAVLKGLAPKLIDPVNMRATIGELHLTTRAHPLTQHA
jgi:hypothetical protein